MFADEASSTASLDLSLSSPRPLMSPSLIKAAPRAGRRVRFADEASPAASLHLSRASPRLLGPPSSMEAALRVGRCARFADEASSAAPLVLSPASPQLLRPPSSFEEARRAGHRVRFADEASSVVPLDASSKLAHPGGSIVSSDSGEKLAALIWRKRQLGIHLTADQERAVQARVAETETCLAPPSRCSGGSSASNSRGDASALSSLVNDVGSSSLSSADNSCVADLGSGVRTRDAVSSALGEDGPRATEASPVKPIARLRLGSAQPHLVDGAAADAGPRLALPGASLRRLEPELRSVLLGEAHPSANVPPSTGWAEAPVVLEPPTPLTTAELIPRAMIERLHTFRRRVAECLATARDGRWQVTRSQRPAPLYAAGVDCVLPAGRGWAWRFDKADERWYPLMPSSWPSQPPESDLDIGSIVDYAEKFGFPDAEIVSFMAHGYILDQSLIFAPSWARHTLMRSRSRLPSINVPRRTATAAGSTTDSLCRLSDQCAPTR